MGQEKLPVPSRADRGSEEPSAANMAPLSPAQGNPAPRSLTLQEVRLSPMNLPPPPDGFIGRADILSELRKRTRAGGITILKGEGGIGKTALALMAAYAQYDAGELPGGVAWLNCEVGPSRDQCLHQMAHVFFGDSMQKENIERCSSLVVDHLRQRCALVVFDNFETVADDREILRWIKNARPPVRILVTTREILPGFLGRVIPVLEMPRVDSMRLFIERAAARGMHIEGQDEVVNDLCRAAGDIPLFIELLAARAASLPLTRLRERLYRDLSVLDAQDDPNRPVRHQNAQACFSVSLETLSQRARDLFTHLSVLPEDVDLEVITALMGKGDWDQVVEELVNASLWQLEHEWYTVNTLIRQFALEQLGSSRAAVEHQVARAMSRLALTWVPVVSELPRGGKWFFTGTRNLWACVDFAITAGDWSTVEKLVNASCSFYMSGSLKDCKRLNKELLHALQHRKSLSAVGRTFSHLGGLYEQHLRYHKAEEAYRQSLAILDNSGDRGFARRTLNGLGRVCQFQARWGEAGEAYKQSLTIHRASGDRRGEAAELYNLGNVYRSQERWGEAEEAYKQSLALSREVADHVGEMLTLNRLGEVYVEQHRWSEAEEAYRKSLAVEHADAELKLKGDAHRGLGFVCLNQQRWQEAEDAFRQFLRISRSSHPFYRGIALRGLGISYLEQGRWKKAEVALRRSLKIHRSGFGDMDFIGSRWATAETDQYFETAFSFDGRLNERRVLDLLGQACLEQKHQDKAADVYRQISAVCRELGDRAGESQALNKLAYVHQLQARWGEAEEAYKQGLTIHRASGDRRGEAAELYNLGNVYRSQERWGEAEEAYKQSLALSREVADHVGEMLTLNRLGEVYVEQHRWSEAEEAYRQSLAVEHADTQLKLKGDARRGLGFVCLNQQRWQEAEDAFRQYLDNERDLSGYFAGEALRH